MKLNNYWTDDDEASQLFDFIPPFISLASTVFTETNEIFEYLVKQRLPDEILFGNIW